MNSDLMHPAGEWPADDDAGAVAVVQPLELGPALLAVRADLADPDLVAHNFDGLSAFRDAPGNSLGRLKFVLHTPTLLVLMEHLCLAPKPMHKLNAH